MLKQLQSHAKIKLKWLYLYCAFVQNSPIHTHIQCAGSYWPDHRSCVRPLRHVDRRSWGLNRQPCDQWTPALPPEPLQLNYIWRLSDEKMFHFTCLKRGFTPSLRSYANCRFIHVHTNPSSSLEAQLNSSADASSASCPCFMVNVSLASASN